MSEASDPPSSATPPGPAPAAPRAYRRNHYRLLHVQPEAPVEVIKASYRTLMSRLRMHPDLGGSHEEAALINEAYAVLCDPALRADYDRQLRWRQRLDLMRARMTDLHPGSEHSPSAGPGTHPGTHPQAQGFRPATPGNAGARSARMYQSMQSADMGAQPEPHAQRTSAAPAGRMGCAFCGSINPMTRSDAPMCTRCSAPLSPVRLVQVAHFRNAGLNRRAAARRPRNHDTIAYWGSPPKRHVVRWRDLSANGLSLWSPVALNPGLRLHLVDQDIQTVAEVVACEPHQDMHRNPQAEIWLVRARLLTLRAIRRSGLFCSAQA